MQSQPDLGDRGLAAIPGKALRLLRHEYERDTLIMVGLPLLIVVGAILGLINLLACIHLVAVFLNG